MYKCRRCGKLIAEIDLYRQSTNYFYHEKCWKEIQSSTLEPNDVAWKVRMYELITKELHKKYNFYQIEKQCDKMVQEGKTLKGIYYTFFYTFILKGVEFDPKYGVGLLPFKYEEAIPYWISRFKQEKDIQQQVEYYAEKAAGSPDRIIVLEKKKERTLTPEPNID